MLIRIFRSFSGARKALLVNCELASLIRVEDLELPLFKGFHEGLNAKTGIQGVRDLPGEDTAAVPVDDGHQIHEALEHSAVGDVCAPDLIRTKDLHMTQEVRIDLVIR
jgi:hypothetical protein